MSKVMKWQYAGKADITLGKEVHINPLPKIALYVTIFIIVVTCALGFIFRDFLYDAFVNPQIVLKYVKLTDIGYELDIPYQKQFIASDWIDEINTKEYEAFMNPDNLDYVYSIEGNVDVNTLGSYQVIYNSNNRIKSQQLILTVNVKDTISPIVKVKNPITEKELFENAEGKYGPIIVDKSYENYWKAENFILDVSDNYSDNITITYPEKPNFNILEDSEIDMTYIVTDESGNSTEIIVQLYIVLELDSIDDTAKDDLEARIRALEEELAQQTQQQNNNNKHDSGTDKPSGNNNPPTNNDNNDNTDGPPAQNDDGTNTVKPPQLTADSFTWSVSADGAPGMDPAAMGKFLMTARSHLHYYNYYGTEAWNTSAPFQTFQPDGPGTYTIHWEAENGLSCDQTVYLTE